MSHEKAIYFGSDAVPVELREQRFDTDEDLESLLARSPNLLAGAQLTAQDASRWFVVGRQFPIRSRDGTHGAVDLLVLDQNGVPTLVEINRGETREQRRNIVGQILDHSSGLRYGKLDAIRDYYEERELAEGPSEGFTDLLDGMHAEEFWKSVAENIEAGRIRMVLAADEITGDLQAIVEYLNEQLVSAEIYALGVLQYMGGGGERVLVPRLAGATAAARTTKYRAGPTGPGVEVLLEGASDTVREAANLLGVWAHRNNLRCMDTSWSRRWVAPDGDTFMRLHPRHNFLEVNLAPLRQAGSNEEVDEFVRAVRRENPRERGERLPGVGCAELVDKWVLMETTLDGLLALRSL